LIVVYHLFDNTGTVTTTDTLGNTYQSCGTTELWNNGNWSAEIMYAADVKAGANTVEAAYGTRINTAKTNSKFG
jgi:hypothetical protein